MWAEKRPHGWLKGVLGVLGLAPWPLFNPHLSDLTKGVKGICLVMISKLTSNLENVKNECFYMSVFRILRTGKILLFAINKRINFIESRISPCCPVIKI
jgi:hypothetical protein